MAGEFVIGNMVAKLAADTSDFIKDMTGAADVAKKFQKDAGAVEQGGKKISGTLTTIGTIAAGFLTAGAVENAGRALLGFFKDSVGEAERAAQAQAQLEAVIRSTGGAAGVSAAQINGMADDLSGLTGVEDDLIVKNSALLLTFTEVGEEVFPQAMQAALDMSAVIGQDLQSSVTQLGKALQNPVEGMSALRRVGVMFTDDQEKMIKGLVEAGKEEEAQKMILAELNKEFGGSAKAMHEAGTKADDLKNAFGNLKEEIGRGLLPAVGETNTGITGMINAATTMMDAQTSLREAQKLGIITQQELGDQLANIAFTSYTSADALKWLATQTEEWTAQQDMGIDALNSGQSALEGYTGAVKGTAKATNDVAEANKKAEKTTRDWMSELDTSIDTTIANWLNEMEFMAGGGGQIQSAAEAVKQALLAQQITPEEAKQYWNQLYVEAEKLKVEMGEITADQAARNISATLGVSLQEALKLVKQVKSAAQFDVTSWIHIKVKYSGNPLGVSGGILAGGHAAGGPIGVGDISWVGEKGPELFVPNVSGKIIPNNEVGDWVGGDQGGGDTYNEYTIINNNEKAAAMNASILMNSRLQRLSGGMG